ncbi:rhodanese-like domain-containing protein [Achromobacter aloeverae]|uniref:Sulfurtransferase n=1 Tax=Achromobacter aloeverae TaxID=1750518 RepID=A0A4Q1HDC5_9BURK|nr:rhodanese-like domain-containing protein [Achromobacter aloeverae]RXN83794.1 sulfurtransferase [Achromobacter aloeverae]
MESFPVMDAAALKAALAGVSRAAAHGAELALLDVSEEGEFGFGHLLRAVNVPYSRLELLVEPLVPRKTCPVVLMDQGNGIAMRAAARLAARGYRDIRVFPGGKAAWAQAGGELFAGVYVPSKAFGEWVEHAFDTPHIDVEELARLVQARADLVILDPRTEAEHAAGHVPTAVNCPGGELVYRFDDLVPSPETLVVVACGGRTRGIVGAQALINAGVPNRVVHLADGNHGWRLSGRELERGLARRAHITPAGADVARARARTLAARFAVPTASEAQLAAWQADPARTTVVFDVRTPAEYARGHHPLARNAPGGQLVQATDQWLGTLGARVVLVDSDGVRAVVTAQWLLHMGWDVHVLERTADADDDLAPAATDESSMGVLGPDEAARVQRELRGAIQAAPEIDVRAAQAAMLAGALAVSLDRSVEYLALHPAGAVWANRARLDALDAEIARGRALVLFSEDGRVAQLAALDLLERGGGKAHVSVAHGGLHAWRAAGLPVASANEDALPAADRIDFLQWAPGRRQGNKDAMQAYLNWEKNLLRQVAAEGFHYGPA